VTLIALAVTGRGLCDLTAPAVRADDEAVLRGRAAFETLRVYEGRPFRLHEHLDRLEGSAKRIGLPEVARPALEDLVQLVLDRPAGEDTVLRLVWTPGPREGPPSGLVLLSEIPPWIERVRSRGSKIVTLRGVRADVPWLLPGVKSTSYAVNVAAEAEAQRRGADDAVFVDGDGTVLEGTVTNVWWRRDDVLFTPSLELGILAGVTRGALLELAEGAGYRVEEGVYPLDDLVSADEAFTSSSVREVLAVVDVDGTALGRGPAADTLQAALRRAASTLSS
jgi:4-amino-4-deoxychorismate lyase